MRLLYLLLLFVLPFSGFASQIDFSVDTLNVGNVVAGNSTIDKSYTVSYNGAGATGLITITSLSLNFNLSTTPNGPFLPVITVLASGSGDFPVYVRFNSLLAAGRVDGQITHVLVGGGGASGTLPIRAGALTVQPTTPSGLSNSSTTMTSTVLYFSGGNGTNRLIVMKEGSPPQGKPIDGISYTNANPNFAAAPALGDAKLIYNSTGNSVTVTGLSPSKTYHFALYEYNSTVFPSAVNYNENPVRTTAFTGTVLAITLLDFHALRTREGDLLRWRTATETPQDTIEIQKSLDGKTFTRLAVVPCTGIPKSYEYNLGIVPGVYFYRLALRNDNGTITYSTILRLQYPYMDMAIFPNPCMDELNVEVEEPGTLKMIDQMGRVMMEKELMKGRQRFDISSVSSGFYFMHTDQAGVRIVTKMVKQ